MFCKKCGEKMKDDWKVCPNCGGTMDEKPEEAIESNKVKGEAGKPEKEKKPIFKKWWFWLIVVILISVIGNVMGGNNSDSSNSIPKSEGIEAKEESEDIESTTEENLDSLLGLYVASEDNDVVPYTVNEKATVFLTAHEDYFPTKNYNQIAGEVDSSIEYKHVEKNSNQYGDKLMELPELYVMSISETDLGNEQVFTEVETTDGDSFYYILYVGELADIYKADIIKVVGLPLSISGYENISGGSTTTLVLAGSYIEKIDSGDEY